MRTAAETLKSLTLELGGNDPALVYPNIDAKALAPYVLLAGKSFH